MIMLGTVALATAPAARAHDVPFAWSVGKVMRMTDGARVGVGGRVVRIDVETTLCAGQGTPTRRRGVRVWRHFACTYTTFTRQRPGRDVDFRVHVLGSRRFAITNARWVPDAP
jgi:hypothetical protein